MRAELKQSREGAKRRAAAAAAVSPAAPPTGGTADHGEYLVGLSGQLTDNDRHVVRVADAVVDDDGEEGRGNHGVVGDGDDFFTVIEAAKQIRPDEAMLWS